MVNRRMKLYSSVCLASVQIQGNTGYGDLNHHQGIDYYIHRLLIRLTTIQNSAIIRV